MELSSTTRALKIKLLFTLLVEEATLTLLNFL